MTVKTLAPDDPRHGKYSSYTNYRCRCEKCKLANASASLKSRRGITGQEKLDMIEKQEGKCASCGFELSEDRRLVHLDHDHTTGQVRSVLCHGCNIALGYLKESPERIRGLLEYVKRWC